MVFTSGRDDGHDFTISLDEEFRCPEGKYGIYLINASICNGRNTISTEIGNNSMSYTPSGGAKKTITIPDGNYSFDLLVDVIHAILRLNGDVDLNGTTGETDTADDLYLIDFAVNQAQGRVDMTVRSNCEVDFSTGGLNTVLGFNATTFTDTTGTRTTFTGTEIPDINNGLMQGMIWCDRVEGGWVNGKKNRILYPYPITAPPFAFQKVTPTRPLILPLDNRWKTINFKILDQDMQPLETGGERTSISVGITRINASH